MDLQLILTDCGIPQCRHQQVHGGDISQAYRLYGDRDYFLKINDAAQYPGMFVSEAAGLSELAAGCSLRVPHVVQCGGVKGLQYLLLEWVESGAAKPGTWEKFGSALAQMHLKKQHYFGWKGDNYIGSLLQQNHAHDTWPLFYAVCRILPLASSLFNEGDFSKADVAGIESLCNKLHQFFPSESPSLLHGDLWSGNFMLTNTGEVAIYDPAVYYGHREMDIGMSMLFGGFDERFYKAYNELYPLAPGWEQRLPLTQLYPLLVHAVLFGGNYIGSARSIIRKFC